MSTKELPVIGNLDITSVSEVGEELKDLSVVRGLNDGLLNQLINYAKTDDDVGRFTSDRTRFESREAFHEWLISKQRTIYALTNEAGELFGIYWLGEKPLPEDRDFIININPQNYSVTAAIRLYGEARGKGLAKEFRDIAVTDFLGMSGNEGKRIWGETYETNEAAIASMIKNGYRQVTSPDENGRIIYISTECMRREG